MEVFNHPVVFGSMFLLLCFLPAVVGTIATIKECERLRVFHVKTYYQLGAPDYAKMNRWFTPLRKRWSGFLKSGDYLRLNDWRPTRLCKICLVFEWYGQFMGAAVIVFLGYNLLVQAANANGTVTITVKAAVDVAAPTITLNSASTPSLARLGPTPKTARAPTPPSPVASTPSSLPSTSSTTARPTPQATPARPPAGWSLFALLAQSSFPIVRVVSRPRAHRLWAG